jgi:hypothetical protein
MPGKIKPEKRPLPLKTRQIFNTRGSILSAMLPGTPGSLASMKLSSLVRKKKDPKPNTIKKYEAARKSLKSPVKKGR